MLVDERGLQFEPITGKKLNEIMRQNDTINIAILSGSSYKPVDQIKDIATEKVKFYPMNSVGTNYTVKIGDRNLILTQEYHYDEETNTLSFYKLA